MPQPLHHTARCVRDIDARLRFSRDGLGLEERSRRIDQPGPRGPVPMATVHDPDGFLVELIHAPNPQA